MASIIYTLREQAPLQKGFMSEAIMLQRQSHQRMETKFSDTFQDPYPGWPREDFILNRFIQSEWNCMLLVFPRPDSCYHLTRYCFKLDDISSS